MDALWVEAAMLFRFTSWCHGVSSESVRRPAIVPGPLAPNEHASGVSASQDSILGRPSVGQAAIATYVAAIYDSSAK